MNATLLLCRIVGLAVFGAVAIIPVSADTGFSIYPNTAVLGSSVSFYDYGRLESKVSQYPVGFFDRSGDALGYGAAYSNIFGYHFCSLCDLSIHIMILADRYPIK